MIIKLLKSIGPAIIVAAVVLGPGSILTSSKVGATLGLLGLPVIAVATVLLIGLVALSATLGAVYEKSVCNELADRLGRPVAVFIGMVLFGVVALFQSSNNLALVGGLEPMIGAEPFSFRIQAGILIAFNIAIIVCLYRLRDLYRTVESLMKMLIGLVTASFVLNAVAAFGQTSDAAPVESSASVDWLALLGMIGTTLSVGGAFYQSYLVREKNWKLPELKNALTDSVVSISVLGLVTALLLLTSWKVFSGRAEAAQLESVADIARQLEPLFGQWATIIFCVGILAGALSSFLVNSLIGGTVLSDSLGLGSRLTDRWPVHLTTLGLVVGMLVAIARLQSREEAVHLITFAQALTVIGSPALAAALLYLGTRPELTGERRVSRLVLSLSVVAFVVSCAVAIKTAVTVYNRF